MAFRVRVLVRFAASLRTWDGALVSLSVFACAP